MLSDFQTFIRSLFRVDKQVLHLLVINLDHWNLHLEGSWAICIWLYSGKYLLANLRNDTFICIETNHGVGLARACLAISEKAAVVALKSICEHFLAKDGVNKFLICVGNSRSLPLFCLVWVVISFRVCTKTVKRPEAIVKSKVSFVSSVIDNSRYRSILTIIPITIFTHSLAPSLSSQELKGQVLTATLTLIN